MAFGCTVAVLLALVGASTHSDELIAPGQAPPTRVDASHDILFGTHWRKNLVRFGRHRSVALSFGRPAISKAHRLVVVGTGEGTIFAFDVESGKERWRFQHRGVFQGAISLVASSPRRTTPDLAIAGSSDGEVVALDLGTGELRWKTTLEGASRAPAAAKDGIGYLTTDGNKVAAINLSDGKVLWSKGRTKPAKLTIDGHAKVALAGSRAVVSYADGYVETYRLKDGATLWSRPLSLTGGEFVDADADSVVDGNRLYVASYSDGIYALKLKDGQTIWHAKAPAVSALMLFDQTLIAASADGYIWGLDAAKGSMRYRMSFPSGCASRMSRVGELVILTTGENGLLVFNGYNGKPRQATRLTSRVCSAPFVSEKDVAFITESGRLYAMRQGISGLVR